jgi:transketolase
MNYEEILKDLALSDERFIVMTAENRIAIRNLQEPLGNRYIDTGISEQSLIGIASGLALRGRIPVVHALAPFLTMRAYEFIRTNIGLQNLPVKLVGSIPGFLSDGNGPTHQAVEDISLMRGIPNMNIFCPADNDDMNRCIKKVLLSEKPFYIRYNTSNPIIEHNDNFEIGKAEIFGEGGIVILTYGFIFNEAYKSALLLTSKGYSVKIINLRTVKPIDEETIIGSLKKAKLVITVEDHFASGGLSSIIAEIALSNGISVNHLGINLGEHWFKPCLMNNLLDYEGFTAQKIADKILTKLGKN